MIRHLSREHEVTVASLVRSAEEAEEGRGLSDYCSKYLMERIGKSEAVTRMVTRLPTRAPSSMGYFHSPRLKQRIRRELASTKYDLLFVHCAFAALYVASESDVPKFLDFGDMDSQKWLDYSKFRKLPLSVGYYLEGKKLESAERQLAKQFDYCSCTTQAELETLKSFDTDTPSAVIRNGVDYEFFQGTGAPYDGNVISFVGRMDYFPNQQCMIDFCKNTLPLIRQRCPTTQLAIVGAAPSRRVRKLGELPGVTVTGSVPDVRSYVLRSAVSVAPLNIARGTQNKILESLAMGVPVVASTKAAGGIDAVPGEHLLTASSPREYAAAVLLLLNDPLTRRKFSEAGRARVLSHHDWRNSFRRLDTLIEDCLKLTCEKARSSPASTGALRAEGR